MIYLGVHQSIPESKHQILCSQPFQLQSLSRHAAEVARQSAVLAASRLAEEQARHFKAKELNKTIVETKSSPPKPEPKPVTVPIAPTFKVI